jgi:hypothetical protein
MKLSKHTELLIIIAAAFGIFLVAGIASASDADTLQPANATTNFESIRVGVAGLGGVTFFNGSVLNEDGPYVIADDLRVDGSIWRGPSKGMSDGQPLKIADTMMPALDNANDIGLDTHQWRNIYYRDTLQGGSAHVEELTADTGAIANELTVADYIAVGGGTGHTGTTIDTNGNIQMDGHLVAAGANFSGGIDVGEITLDGSLSQVPNEHGAVKATVYYDPGTTPGTCGRSWATSGNIGCTGGGPTSFITMGFNLTGRYWTLTSTSPDHVATASILGTNQLQVVTYTGGVATTAPYMLAIY